MTTSTPPSHQNAHEAVRERFIGSLLGTFAGDALGMPVEGLSSAAVARGHRLIRDLLDARLGRGTYTDDTEMTLALTGSLVARRGLDQDHLAAQLARWADERRGYSPGTWENLRAIRSGGDWRTVARRRIVGGSFGNAAAARAAPVGLLMHRDLGRCADIARLSAAPTHAHPLGGGGAAVQAMATALALRWGAEEPAGFSPTRFLELIGERLLDNECLFLECFEKLSLMLERHPGLPLDAPPADWFERAEAVAAVLGADPRAFESVPAALYAFLAQRDSFEGALVAAVSLGGDTDTIAAMTGALAGAHLGVGAIPTRWLSGLEGGPRGRDYAAGSADDLFLLWLERHSSDPLDPPFL